MFYKEDGVTMILALFIIITLLSLVFAFVSMMTKQNNNLQFTINEKKAFYGAEAGVETAMTYLNRLDSLTKEQQINGRLNQVSYQVKINKGQIHKYKIKSQASYNGINKTIIVKLEEINNKELDGLVIAAWKEW